MPPTTEKQLTHPENSHPGVAGRKFGSYALTPEEMQNSIEEWMESFKEDGKNEKLTPALTHLAFHLGVTRKTLYNYKGRDEYRPLVERAKTFCEMHVEQKLFDPAIRGAGPIFNLKANHEWRDGSEGKNFNINFNWNTVQQEFEKRRKQIEDPAYVPEPDTIDI